MHDPDRLLLSLREFEENTPDKRWLGVISSGGHPVINPEIECVICDAKYFPDKEKAQAWFDDQSLTKPWEQRH